MNLWVVNAAAFTQQFCRFTAQRIGVEPMLTDLRIASGRIRSSSAAFTLTRNMCDCSTLIGGRNDAPARDEVEAEAWLDWLHTLPAHVPHVSRVAVLRAWSPEEGSVVPAQARGIQISELDEDALRNIRDDGLLTIDYPRVV